MAITHQGIHRTYEVDDQETLQSIMDIFPPKHIESAIACFEANHFCSWVTKYSDSKYDDTVTVTRKK